MTAADRTPDKPLWKRGGFWTALIAIAGVIVTVWQVREAKNQFLTSSASGAYTDILNGLSSTSPAVQVDAVARLVRFVTVDSSRTSSVDQSYQAKSLQQTLVTFIRAESSVPATGLVDYDQHPPQWDVAAIAAKQLEQLLAYLHGRSAVDSIFRGSAQSYAISSIELDHVDLHGFNQAGLTVDVSTDLDGADLREAQLSGIRVTAPLNLEQADLTCADLNGSSDRPASLGSADLAYADLTGANLSSLDLRSVQNLTPQEVQHTVFDQRTKWPRYYWQGRQRLSFVPPRPDDAMQNNRLECTYLIQHMTGMRAGQGYQSRWGWPKSADTSPRASGLRAVRTLRDPATCLRRYADGLPSTAFSEGPQTVAGQLVRKC
jgi:hypothetical protein